MYKTPYFVDQVVGLQYLPEMLGVRNVGGESFPVNIFVA